MSKKKEKNYLTYIPVLNNEHDWRVEDEIVTVDFVNKGFYNKIAQKVFKSSKVSHIELDEFGSYVWQQVDGEKDILQIADLVKDKFGAKVEPLYERICKYFGVLENENFVKLTDRG